MKILLFIALTAASADKPQQQVMVMPDLPTCIQAAGNMLMQYSQSPEMKKEGASFQAGCVLVGPQPGM